MKARETDAPTYRHLRKVIRALVHTETPPQDDLGCTHGIQQFHVTQNSLHENG